MGAWYETAQRDLPWRRTRDPYRIWLSETMLQQTRVDTVVGFYERFLERFPNVQALADADEEDVLRAWAGLGYYSRARNLKKAAEQIAREHAGRIPRQADALRSLPGVGPYTAGAVRSIAFRQPAAIVDGNVRRVFSRWLAMAEPEDAKLWRLAEALVPDDRPDIFNQALMELGATVCTPRQPRCSECPVAPSCRGRASGAPEAYPAARKRTPPIEIEGVAGLLRWGETDRVLFLRRPARGLLGGLWELPSVEGTSLDALVQRIEDTTGIRVRAGGRLGSVRHLFTHRALSLRIERLEPIRSNEYEPHLAPPAAAELRWCDAAERAELALSTLMRKALRLALG